MEPQTLTGHTRANVDEWPYSIKFHDFATFLGLPAERDSRGIYWRGDQDTAKKIEQIYSWGRAAAKTDDHVVVKTKVKQLQRHLGTNVVGKSLVDVLWRYTRMNTELNYLKEEVDQMEEGRPRPPTPPVNDWRKKLAKYHPPLKRVNVIDHIKKATEPVRKQVVIQTQKAIKEAIQEGIRSVFK